MKILILGGNGQVGWELQRSLAALGEVAAVDRRQADLADAESLRHALRNFTPEVIVNAAAYTAVDKAESEPDLAYRINAIAPSVMADEAKSTGAWLVHYSTDYVFDGRQEISYTEADATGPLSVYGRTKLEGERLIQASGCKALIFRTSWVYAARGNNFAKTMLRLAKERGQLQIVSDQWGAPTSAELIADITAQALHQAMQKPELAGLYHLTADGATTWHGYACHVLAQAQALGQLLKVRPSEVRAIATADYPLPAARPKSSRLDTTKLQNAFDLYLPAWQVHINRMLKETLGDY
ncbi:dTDP-4-dehydrorhamnose reductase subunit, NAD(P)-binding, of dTDP-L-rhamnose synthase [Candidatus Methylobacter favarea]|uniref:dTDP-4-dehydrorhamnose reductase n=1 Tax=Candidatus Methylobacter favarea TaxID=2707345 RepID=A0A8S0XDS3_9GAMM|nr:dTDP-4-dehydrorhamnose reductase [Candidatus Methylobacter favarea]CAA9888577.1 dTDP-4-dehydrorhamnose reductase subunit, NAD(P)-binding, of dTDP-L-rhamnose synthase [Candidatus Methylobacter favarea]